MGGAKSKSTTTIRVPNEVYERLKDEAVKDNMTIGEVLMRFLPQPPWVGPPLPRGWGIKWRDKVVGEKKEQGEERQGGKGRKPATSEADQGKKLW